MDKKRLENMLRNYKKNKSKVEISEERIRMWEKAMDNPSSIAYLQATGTEIGMPRANNNTSPVEIEVFKKAETESEAMELVKEWIREEENRMLHIKTEVNMVEKALNGLTNMERYLIELKYFHKMIWRDIEANYNQRKSIGDNYLSDRTLKRKCKEIVSLMLEIFNS